eukprot:CCRYP_015255-RA/>CCRYP_015255-RA protein AED:0.41 eAED:0.49 QI:0/0/0/1/0/0/2/0/541
MIHEPRSTEEATQHVVHILDAKYEKADLQSVVDNNCPHLSLQDQNKLLELLRKYDDLFDGTLGDWNTEPVSFELKEGVKADHGRAYPVPHSVKETLMKELKRLCDLGVLLWQPVSEWASPSFIVPKKDQTVHFLSYFREVNKRIVRKPFPLPNISTVMQELEGFTFATALDLNMGYYTIRLDPNASEICAIIFPWGQYSYLRLPMGIAGECGHTKQSKLLKVKKKPWKWTEEHQKAFDDVKATIAKDVSLAYPNYSKGFEIGSKRQLGAVITQNNRPIAFFSRKLSVCQQKYNVTEIELLAIVETLKEFKGKLWGQPIVVYTDHKNLMQDALGLTCVRVYRWCLLLEEYGPEIVYIKGIHNIVADVISHLDFGSTKDVKENWMTFTKCWCYYTMQAEEEPSPVKHSDLMNFFASRSEEIAIYPLAFREIVTAQHTDKTLDKLSLLEAYKPQLVENVQVLCKDGKLVISQELQPQAVQWYHHYLQHPGTTHLEETLRAAMYWKGLRRSVPTFAKSTNNANVSTVNYLQNWLYQTPGRYYVWT